MRIFLAIVTLAVGLALAVMPVGHALALQHHAAHTQLDYGADKATAVAVCCPATSLPATAMVARPVSASSVAWSGLIEIERSGRLLAPEPPPPRL